MNFIIRPYKQGEEKYVADLHKALYSTEYSWGPSFTDYAMKIATDFAKGSKNDREELFVADCDGVLAGCIMLCQADDPSVGQLRLFCRREGLSTLWHWFSADCRFYAKSQGFRVSENYSLDSQPLTDAIRHYEKLGFKATESVENTTWNTDGKPLDEIKMELFL